MRRGGVGLDAAVIGGGVVLLIAGFLPWWDSGVNVGGVPLAPARGLNAWDASVAWWLPVLTGIIAGGLWVLDRLGVVSARWLPGVTVLVGVVGLGLIVGRWLSFPPSSGDFGWYAYAPVTDGQAATVGYGTPGIGLWLAGAALATQAAAAAVLARRSRSDPGRRPGTRTVELGEQGQGGAGHS